MSCIIRCKTSNTPYMYNRDINKNVATCIAIDKEIRSFLESLLANLYDVYKSNNNAKTIKAEMEIRLRALNITGLEIHSYSVVPMGFKIKTYGEKDLHIYFSKDRNLVIAEVEVPSYKVKGISNDFFTLMDIIVQSGILNGANNGALNRGVYVCKVNNANGQMEVHTPYKYNMLCFPLSINGQILGYAFDTIKKVEERK